MSKETRPLRIGTRGSRLALHQAHLVERLLKAKRPGLPVEIVIIKTEGDLSTAPLEQISGQGIFTRELDRALLEGKVDMGVHSLKDLPTRMREGIDLVAVPDREVAHDAFVSARYSSPEALPEKARVGTCSPRRRAQLLRIRPDLQMVDFRGNVETRLRKLEAGEVDATILACAGLIRLGLEKVITQRLPLDGFIPAPGQGALAVTVRCGDGEPSALAAEITNEAAHRAVEGERAFLLRLGGGCKTPIACHAFFRGERLVINGLVSSPDGKTVLQGAKSGSGNEAKILGDELGEKLLQEGAGRLIVPEAP
jgi:hydroxymethylbilane synthase